MVERISQPSRALSPRKERSEVRFALSYEALKMKSTSSARQISAIFFAMRHTNFSDSITHGPRMNAGRAPPIVTLPTRNGFVFTMIDRSGGLSPSHYFARASSFAQDRQWQKAHTIPERRAKPRRASPKGKGDANRTGNSKWKTLLVCAAESHS